jgi:hypothetical protein
MDPHVAQVELRIVAGDTLLPYTDGLDDDVAILAIGIPPDPASRRHTPCSAARKRSVRASASWRPAWITTIRPTKERSHVTRTSSVVMTRPASTCGSLESPTRPMR